MTERTVTVCASCLCASCWQGIFMCIESRDVGTVEMPVTELDTLNREHPNHYSAATVAEVCGGPDPSVPVDGYDAVHAWYQAPRGCGEFME